MDIGDYIKTFTLDEHMANILYFCAKEYLEKEATVPMAKLYAETLIVRMIVVKMCVPKPALNSTKHRLNQIDVDTNRERLGQMITYFARKVPPGQELPLAHSLCKRGFGPYILNTTKPGYVFSFLMRLAENLESLDEFDSILRQTKLLEEVAPLPAIEDYFFGVSSFGDIKSNPAVWEIASKHCKGDESHTFAYHHPNY